MTKEAEIKELEACLPPELVLKTSDLFLQIDFLIKEEALFYPTSWFLENPARTAALYQKHYRIYFKQFLEKQEAYNKKQTRLNYLKNSTKRRD